MLCNWTRFSVVFSLSLCLNLPPDLVLQYRTHMQNMKMSPSFERNAHPAQYFTQRVDHFDDSNQATFQQRFWSNSAFYKAGGPIFIVVGGYYETDPSYIFNASLEWPNLGQSHNAYMFTLEHRYYGNSMPVPRRLEASDFVYLNTSQAVADLVSFIQSIKANYTELSDSKIVTMGSSYSGNLAVWSRIANPNLINIAVASSAPVEAKFDFFELMDGVEDELSVTSAACAQSVSTGFNQVAQLLRSPSGRAQIKTTFNLCEEVNVTDTQGLRYFWTTIYGPYLTIGEYSGLNSPPYRGMLTLQNGICRFHTGNSNSPMARMQAVNENYNAAWGSTYCTDIDYSGYIGYYKNPDGGLYADMARAWIYQSCTEFGYFQTTDSANSEQFWGGSTVPVDYYVDQCQQVFGTQLSASQISSGVDRLNALYGGNKNQISHVIYINGQLDPWRNLTVFSSNVADVENVVIQGGTHRNDIYTIDASSDPPALTTARAQVSSTLSSWLSQP